MLRTNTSYEWSTSYRSCLTMLGMFFLLCGWGMWSANAATAKTSGDWALIVVFEIFFAGVGIFLIGYRMKFTVYPAERRAVRAIRFLGVPLSSRAWSFSDFTGVEIRLIAGSRGARSATVNLKQRNSSESVLVLSFMAREDIPPAASELARELSETMGIPINPPR